MTHRIPADLRERLPSVVAALERAADLAHAPPEGSYVHRVIVQKARLRRRDGVVQSTGARATLEVWYGRTLRADETRE